MKKKLLSLLILFSLLLSITVGDTTLLGRDASLFKTTVSADEPGDPDPEEANRLRVVIYYNDVPIANSRYGDVGYDFNSFVKGGTLTLRAEDTEGNLVPKATIYYTTSEDSTLGIAYTTPAFPASATSAELARPANLFERHDGGVSPIVRIPNGEDKAAAGTKTFTGGEGSIDVPASGINHEVFTVSAFAQVADGTFRNSHPATRSLILTSNRWLGTDFMVFAIYSDARGLWNEGEDKDITGSKDVNHDGILVTGRGRRRWNTEWNTLNPTIPVDFGSYGPMQDLFAPTLPANYNLSGRGAERAAFIEMFDPNTGYRHIRQTAGIRVKGGWSRGTIPIEQRTFEIYGRNTYNEYDRGGENTFLFPMFGDQNVEAYGIGRGNLHHRFRRFRVRNGGSDREQGYMRDEMSNELYRQAGLPVPQNYRPSAVFLNGAYYGLTFMKTPRTEDAWSRLYGGDEEKYHLIASRENASAGCYNPGCGRVISNIPPCGCSMAQFNEASGRCEHSSSASNNYTSKGLPQDGAVIGLSKGTCTCAARPAGGCSNNACGTRIVRKPATCNGDRRRCGLPDCDDYSQAELDPMCEAYNGNACAAAGHTREGTAAGKSEGFDECKAVCDFQEVASLMQGGPAFGFPAVDPSFDPDVKPLSIVGLTDQARWEEFNKRVDLDQWLLYYACQIFVSNVDWPDNNMEFWRYFPSEEEKNDPDLHPYLRDGKWRIVAQDGELGYNLWSTTTGNEHMKTRTLDNNLDMVVNRLTVNGHFGSMGNTFVFPSLMQRDDMKTRAANVFNDLMDGAYNFTNSGAAFDRLVASFDFEHRIATTPRQYGGDATPVLLRRVSETGRSTDSLTAGLNPDSYPWPDVAAVDDDRAALKSFLQGRPAAIRGHINSVLGKNVASPDVTLNLTVEGNGHVTMNSRPVGMLNPTTNPGTRKPTDADPRTGGRTLSADGKSVTNATATGNYLSGAIIPIVATPWPGYKVQWPAGVDVDPLDPTNPNRRVVTSSASVTVTFVKDDVYANAHPLSIDAVNSTSYNKRGKDWIEIHNRSDKAISTKGLYISDSGTNTEQNLYRFQLPVIVIRPGERVYLATDDNPASAPEQYPTNPFLKRMRTNFNIGLAERIRITRVTGRKPNGDYVGELVEMVDVTYLLGHQIQQRQPDGNFRIIAPPCGTCKNKYEDCTCPCPGGCGKRIPLCACCRVCGKGYQHPDSNGLTCACPPCPRGCGGTISICLCSPFLVLKPDGDEYPRGYAEVEYDVKRDGTHWNGSAQCPRFLISVTVKAVDGTLTDWKIQTKIPAGAQMGDQWNNQVRGGQYTIANNVITINRLSQGNQDTFNVIPDGTSQSFAFHMWLPPVADDPDPTFDLNRPAPPCDHVVDTWTPLSNDCTTHTGQCTKCNALQTKTKQGNHEPSAANCRQCTKCTFAMGKSCPAGNPCANCIANPICDCGRTLAECGICTVCKNQNCQCTCGPRITEANGMDASAITVTAHSGTTDQGQWNHPSHIKVAGLSGSGGGRTFTVQFPFSVMAVSHHNATINRINDTTYQITLPEWWNNATIELGYQSN